MSRVAKVPIKIPCDIKIKINKGNILVEGKYGKLTHNINDNVAVEHIENQLIFSPRNKSRNGWALSGTTRSIINNMIIGVNRIFTKKLILVGIGYRATIKDNFIDLILGYSHTIKYKLPDGVIAKCPNQNEIQLKSIDKYLIGQVAANLRAIRRPEPYKGKGIRYEDEIIRTKEIKKK